MIKQIILSACLLNLAACASIVEGGSQEISLKTDNDAPVACTVSNSRGSWNIPSTPAMVNISRSQSRLNIACDSMEYSGQTDNQAGPEMWTLGNVLIGGLIGLGVDAATGSMFSYDDMITIPLTSKLARAVPAVPVEISPQTELAPAPMPELIMAPTGNHGLAPASSAAPVAAMPTQTYHQPTVEVIEPAQATQVNANRRVFDPSLSFRKPAAAPVYRAPGSQF